MARERPEEFTGSPSRLPGGQKLLIPSQPKTERLFQVVARKAAGCSGGRAAGCDPASVQTHKSVLQTAVLGKAEKQEPWERIAHVCVAVEMDLHQDMRRQRRPALGASPSFNTVGLIFCSLEKMNLVAF